MKRRQGIDTGVLTVEINQKDPEKKRGIWAGSVQGPISKEFVGGKRIRVRHGVTTHNRFVHYLWDIYGGFGHNGKIN